MEALKVKLQNKKYGGNIEYRTHIAQKGWQDWKKNGQTAGNDRGKNLAMEAVRLKLTGNLRSIMIYIIEFIHNLMVG